MDHNYTFLMKSSQHFDRGRLMIKPLGRVIKSSVIRTYFLNVTNVFNIFAKVDGHDHEICVLCEWGGS